MFTKSGIILAGALWAADTTASVVASRGSAGRCKEVSFSVSGNALNLDLANFNLNLSAQNTTNLTTLATGNYNSKSVSGSETLAGWFCLPTTQNANSTKLQVFRGSFFTNRESWTALGGTALNSPPLAPYQPQTYSWFDYANNLGYPTLAIDTVGTGLSSKPDPILLAQIPYDISLYHDLVTQIRAGTSGQLPQAYTTLYHIGNSLGSEIGNQMAAFYPEDFDQIVLTGFSKEVYSSLPGVSLNLPVPAILVNPKKFAGDGLGYVTSSIEASLTNSFFGDPKVVDFDPKIASLFFQRRDTVSIGDVLTTYLGNNAPTAPSFTGRVLVLTGENDQAFCGLGSGLLSPNTQCGSLLADTGSLFPSADYNYQSVPRTGHALLLHKSAPYLLRVAHDFLAGQSFGK